MTTLEDTLVEQFEAYGGRLLKHGDDDYPDFLHERTKQPDLYVIGRWRAAGLGLCGSRRASDFGLRCAAVAGEVAAEHGLPLVSGYAQGADMQGHLAALKSGATTIAVLAEGIAKFRPPPEYPDVLDGLEQMIVVSQFPLSARWTVINAMERNKLICGLSQVIVAVEPGEKGGTKNAASEALLQAIPLIVVWPSDVDIPPHVDRLAKRGAALVRSEEQLRETVDQCFTVPSTQPPTQVELDFVSRD